MTIAPAAPPPAINREALGRAGIESAQMRAGGCARPVRLVGHTAFVKPQTGEVERVYASADELDGYTYTRCGNRRASVCPPAAGSTRAMPGTCSPADSSAAKASPSPSPTTPAHSPP